MLARSGRNGPPASSTPGIQNQLVVLVDCPPSLGVLTLNALAGASHLVVVTEPSFLALQGIDELLETRDLVHATTTAGSRWPG